MKTSNIQLFIMCAQNSQPALIVWKVELMKVSSSLKVTDEYM